MREIEIGNTVFSTRTSDVEALINADHVRTMPLLQSKRLQTGEIIYLVGTKQVARLTHRRNNVSTSKSCIDMNTPRSYAEA